MQSAASVVASVRVAAKHATTATEASHQKRHAVESTGQKKRGGKTLETHQVNAQNQRKKQIDRGEKKKVHQQHSHIHTHVSHTRKKSHKVKTTVQTLRGTKGVDKGR